MVETATDPIQPSKVLHRLRISRSVRFPFVETPASFSPMSLRRTWIKCLPPNAQEIRERRSVKFAGAEILAITFPTRALPQVCLKGSTIHELSPVGLLGMEAPQKCVRSTPHDDRTQALKSAINLPASHGSEHLALYRAICDNGQLRWTLSARALSGVKGRQILGG